MKTTKKLLCIFLSVILLIGTSALAFQASAKVSTVKKTMLQYSYLNLTFDKPEAENYKCSVSNNKNKYITVDANNEGTYYWLTVTSNKATPKDKKPTITIYKEADGKKTNIKKFQITVKKAKKVDMKSLKLNKGTAVQIKLKNPYDKDYRLEYNKKIIKIKTQYYDGDYEYPTITALKNGKTTVKAYIKGTKTLIGSFKVSVGDYKASIKDSYKSKTIYYNKHIDSRDLIGGTLDLSKAINNYHANSVYSVSVSKSGYIGKTTVNKTETTPKAVSVYSKKTGKVTLTVYEKCGKAKKKKIGTIKLTIKKAKDSKVFDSYCEYDNDGIFYENFISPGDSYNLKNAVVSRYLNFGKEKYHFKESEYTFIASSSNPNIVSVDENGVCHCLALPEGSSPTIKYTVTFKDGSKASGSGQFDIVNEDYWN